MSIGFYRQEYWIGFPFPSPGESQEPEIEPVSPASAGGFLITEPPGNYTVFLRTLLYHTNFFFIEEETETSRDEVIFQASFY